MKLLKYLLILLCFVGFQRVAAQNQATRKKEFIYDKERVYDLRVQTHGWWTLGVRLGKIQTYYKTKFYEFNLGELKHPKESMRTSEFTGVGDSPFGQFSFGKQNRAFVLRAGIGRQRFYSEKAIFKGAAINVNYSVGANLLFLKPYYLILRSQDLPQGVYVRYSPDTERDFLDVSKIENNAPFLEGVNETSVLPGGFARVGVQVDMGTTNQFINAFEAGAQLDVFPKRVPIMVSTENRAYFLNFYVAFLFGKRQ